MMLHMYPAPLPLTGGSMGDVFRVKHIKTRLGSHHTHHFPMIQKHLAGTIHKKNFFIFNDPNMPVMCL